MKLFKIPALLLVFLLIGCAPSIKNNVTRFHQLPPPNGEAIEVVAINPALQTSIEFGSYAELVGQRLGAYGYTPPNGSPTNLIAEIAYEIRPSSGAVAANRSPVSVGVGVGNGGFRRGTSVGVGVSTAFGSSRSEAQYVSALYMNIVRLSDGVRLYEGRVENIGRNQNLPQIMPLLIDSLFRNFPGESGSTNTDIIKPTKE